MNGLTFGGILRSEWIKLRSLRSTIWCYSILVAITFGLGLLFAAALTSQADGMPLNHDAQQAFVVQVATLSISLSQLVVVVLGALVITGEYGTGMIRSTFAAVPSRVPAVVAKALVFGAAVWSQWSEAPCLPRPSSRRVASRPTSPTLASGSL